MCSNVNLAFQTFNARVGGNVAAATYAEFDERETASNGRIDIVSLVARISVSFPVSDWVTIDRPHPKPSQPLSKSIL